ncbi:L-asparagine permease [Streptomyces cinereoruber]|uniref:Amino acid permease n=1 Tax=Streptomyces cinereoruber TaxID=67260 RepID=A0AAV4KIM7_9ACTN|nr:MULTISPECIES: amino acid permease [Streptomyces]AVH98257.1 amino acid permease [Streptomyces sp. WAC00288]KYG52829.1 L-asparagine permease [Streptomyces sp. WAC04657]MBB4159278.1 L-asparagine permease [Streptomyces cinereoruber]MBY8817565.1 amino acid permease [Streptomyces cinereoruber]NIH64262.1 L-asparagine permease [Streptomyces cinereoruber]
MSDRVIAADPLSAAPAASGGTTAATPHVDAGDAGYRKDLKSRHINMIAIGGAIGTGLFLGAGGRMSQAGPSLFIAYAVCGVFAFFVVRALGELVLYRPSSGAFVSYAREFMGEKGAYTAGWLYFLNWSTTAVADITAAATYAHFWSMFSDVPQWILALIALAVVLAANLISVKYFGEMEFWFAIVKVAALVVFMLVGVFLIVTSHDVGGSTPGLANITDNGGIFPHGTMPMLLLIQGVVFAYASVELCGVAAGETENPEKIMPKAINSIMWRVGLFYVGSVVLLALLLPYTAYSGDQSPFVTVFDKLGVPGAAGVMNLVVLTAALSSLNSGLYSTGRILRSMSLAGSAPRFTGVMNKGGVPYGGILLTAGFGVLGVGLNYVMPGEAFELVLNLASIGIIGTWAMIMVCSLLFWRRAEEGKLARPGYRLPWAPYTQIVTLLFLGSVLVLMWMDEGISRTTVNCLPLIAAALVGGWFLVRGRVRATAGTPRD